jgi:hypothetical protein
MKQNSNSSAGTAADSEQMLMFERPATITATRCCTLLFSYRNIFWNILNIKNNKMKFEI